MKQLLEVRELAGADDHALEVALGGGLSNSWSGKMTAWPMAGGGRRWGDEFQEEGLARAVGLVERGFGHGGGAAALVPLAVKFADRAALDLDDEDAGGKKGSEGEAEGALGKALSRERPGNWRPEAADKTGPLEKAGGEAKSGRVEDTWPGAAMMKSASVCWPSSDRIFIECHANQPAGSASAIAA